MSHITELIIWWTGAALILAALAAITMVGAIAIHAAVERIWHGTLRIMQLSTARYWVQRMERKGLTICRADYRRMVAERNPKTVGDFEQVERDAANKAREKDPAA